MWNWYRAGGESEPWASFKMLVQFKGPFVRPELNPFHGMSIFPLLQPRDESNNCMKDATLPSLAAAMLREAKLKHRSQEPWATAIAFNTLDYNAAYEKELEHQRTVMSEYHLSIMLLDYAAYLSQEKSQQEVGHELHLRAEKLRKANGGVRAAAGNSTARSDGGVEVDPDDEDADAARFGCYSKVLFCCSSCSLVESSGPVWRF